MQSIGRMPMAFGEKACLQRVLKFTRWVAAKIFAVAFFNAAHRPEKMVIGACPEMLRLAVQGLLRVERVENTDLFQCFHVAVNAGEGVRETDRRS